MKNIRDLRWLLLILVIFGFSISMSSAHAVTQEVFLAKDRDVEGMGAALNDYFNKITSKRGIIIYSGCQDKFGTDVFIVSNVLKQGLLLEFTGKQFENIVLVDLKDKGDIIIGADGILRGQWQRNRVQNNINQIVKMPFRIFLGKNPAELFDMKFTGKCEDYPEQ